MEEADITINRRNIIRILSSAWASEIRKLSVKANINCQNKIRLDKWWSQKVKQFILIRVSGLNKRDSKKMSWILQIKRRHFKLFLRWFDARRNKLLSLSIFLKLWGEYRFC